MPHDHDKAKQRLKDALEKVKAAQQTGDPMAFAVAMRNARLLTNEIMPELERDATERGQRPDSEVGEILAEFVRLTEYFDQILGRRDH